MLPSEQAGQFLQNALKINTSFFGPTHVHTALRYQALKSLTLSTNQSINQSTKSLLNHSISPISPVSICCPSGCVEWETIVLPWTTRKKLCLPSPAWSVPSIAAVSVCVGVCVSNQTLFVTCAEYNKCRLNREMLYLQALNNQQCSAMRVCQRSHSHVCVFFQDVISVVRHLLRILTGTGTLHTEPSVANTANWLVLLSHDFKVSHLYCRFRC